MRTRKKFEHRISNLEESLDCSSSLINVANKVLVMLINKERALKPIYDFLESSEKKNPKNKIAYEYNKIKELSFHLNFYITLQEVGLNNFLKEFEYDHLVSIFPLIIYREENINDNIFHTSKFQDSMLKEALIEYRLVDFYNHCNPSEFGNLGKYTFRKQCINSGIDGADLNFTFGK